MSNIEKIVGDSGKGLALKYLLDYIKLDEVTLSVRKLDWVIQRFEVSRYQAHQRDVKHLITDKPMANKEKDTLNNPKSH